MGVILLTAMAICGISLWLKKRKESQEHDQPQNKEYDDI
jgi:hypothetical protein